MSAHKSYTVGISILAISGLIFFVSFSQKRKKEIKEPAKPQLVSPSKNVGPNRARQSSQPTPTNQPKTTYASSDEGWELEARPFEVTHRSDNFEWTSEDGTQSDIIRQLVRFPERAEILERNNEFTKRRQLVYLPDNFRETTQQLFDGEISQIPVPGFDGQEFQLRMIDAPDQLVYDGARPLTATFEATVHYPDGRQIEDALAIGAFTDNHWSIEFNLGESSYVYDNRIENQWVVTEYNEDLRTAARLRLTGDSNDVLSDTDNVGTPKKSGN